MGDFQWLNLPNLAHERITVRSIGKGQYPSFDVKPKEDRRFRKRMTKTAEIPRGQGSIVKEQEQCQKALRAMILFVIRFHRNAVRESSG